MKKLISVSLIVLLALVISSCSFTTANLADLTMASAVQDNLPVTVTNVFTTTSPVIYATGTLKNAPEGTEITGEWYYLETDPETYIDSSTLTSVDMNTSFTFSLSIPNNGWPTGDYEIRFFIDDQPSSTLSFTVE